MITIFTDTANHIGLANFVTQRFEGELGLKTGRTRSAYTNAGWLEDLKLDRAYCEQDKACWPDVVPRRVVWQHLSRSCVRTTSFVR
jgi:hypothetical protein